MEVNTFNHSINRKVNVIAQLEFELAHYNVAVQHVTRYTTGTSYGQAALNVRVFVRLLKLSNNELPQYFEEWSLSYERNCEQEQKETFYRIRAICVLTFDFEFLSLLT